MKMVNINDFQYEVVHNEGDCFVLNEIEEKLTDYFDDYDYIFGDFAYDKVRLKGFYESSNKNVRKVNNIEYLEEYRNDYCSYGCRWFLLKKVK